MLTQSSSLPREEHIDLLELLGGLLQQWKFILAVTALFCSTAVVMALLATPVYQADTLIQVEQKQKNLLSEGLGSIMPDLNRGITSEIQLLQSRMVLGETVRALNLEMVITPVYLPLVGRLWERLTGKKPPVLAANISAITDGQPIILTVKDTDHYSIEYDGLMLEGIVGKPLEVNGFSVFVSRIEAEPGTRFQLERLSMQEAIRLLKKRISVSEQGKESGMLNITLTGENRSELTKVLNQLAENYRRQNIERQAERDAQSLIFLKKRLDEVRQTLELSEEKLNIYRQKRESVDLNLEAKSVLEQIVNVDSQLNALTFQEAEIAQLYKKEHPSYRALEDKRRVLESEKSRLGQRISDMPSVQQKILQLSREVESGRAVYMQLLRRQQELSISRSGITGNVRIIDMAIVHSEPLKPKRGLMIILGILLGAVVACGIVMVKSCLRRGIESPDQLEEKGVVVCATVPQSEWLEKRQPRQRYRFTGLWKNSRPMSSALLAVENPSDLAVEALRSLRTGLQFNVNMVQGGVIVITGTTAGSGKTFISSSLATLMAQAGQRVLYIDADLRRGDAHLLFGLNNSKGLSEVLAEGLSPGTVLRHFPAGECDVLTCGRHVADPTRLLMHSRFTELMAWAGERYDVVIVDTPPALAVTDAAIVSRLANAVLLVTRAGVNSVKETTVCLKRLEQEGVRPDGVILNGVMRSPTGYYRDGYRCEGYAYNCTENS